MKLVSIVGMGALLLVALGAQGGTPEDLARQWCADCHNVKGNSTSPLFPRIAGQQHDYLLAQLKAFRDQSRSDPDAHDYMWGMSGRLDDATLEGLATFYAAQKPLPNPATSDPALAKAGEQLFLNGNSDKGTPACQACHGAHAEGTSIAPRLAGQHAAYLTKQLHVFTGQGRPSAVAMHAIIQTLNEQDIQSLAAYLQQLP